MTMRLLPLFFLLGALVLSAVETPVELGDRRELFLDTTLIAEMEGLTRRLHEPQRAGPAIPFDKPWEGRFSAYPTVVKDGYHYRMYYRGRPNVGDENPAVTCYAESLDGITWVKPELGLYEVQGSRANNVILAGAPEFSANFSPFLDTRPSVPSAERFKALAGDRETGLVAFVSADGIRWHQWLEEPVFRQGIFDSQNVAFWSEHEQAYICYFRTWTGPDYTGYRTISRTTSPDFIHWSEPVTMDYGDTPPEQLYTNGTHPYFRAPHIYLALAKRFFPDKAALNPAIAADLVDNPKYRIASSDSVLMSSRGGNRYDRSFMEAFIRPGPGARDWIARDNTPALGVVPGNDREMFLYRMSHYAQPTAHLTRYTLRLDGFVSLHAGFAGGTLTTRPFVFAGDTLELNFETSAAGGLRCALLDVDGQPIPGFTLADCPEIIGDEIAREVSWTGGASLSALAGEPVRLQVELRDGDLYAFRFRNTLK
jgi:hypothetical protein